MNSSESAICQNLLDFKWTGIETSNQKKRGIILKYTRRVVKIPKKWRSLLENIQKQVIQRHIRNQESERDAAEYLKDN